MTARIGLVNYGCLETPSGYVCDNCRMTGVKLWREYSTFRLTLFCAECAVKDSKKEIVVGDDGQSFHKDLNIFTDTIGWWVPAVPTLDNSLWGYGAVPSDARGWWVKLPLKSRAYVAK